MYHLFTEFAHRYDLHTPPGHYQHDHATVIGEALRHTPLNCRLLDVGCGTGVFLEAAAAKGIDGYGIDAAPAMVERARERLGDPDRIRVQRMQEISDQNQYDVICSLSWVIHYCESEKELDDVVLRCYHALRSSGLLILQVANDQQMNGSVNVDSERGPSGEPDDTLFLYQFRALHDPEHRVIAHYVYASRTHRELLTENHELRFGNPVIVSASMSRAGFRKVSVINSNSLSPFVIGIAI
jgi:SAM-dependent methyltransferase